MQTDPKDPQLKSHHYRQLRIQDPPPRRGVHMVAFIQRRKRIHLTNMLDSSYGYIFHPTHHPHCPVASQPTSQTTANPQPPEPRIYCDRLCLEANSSIYKYRRTRNITKPTVYRKAQFIREIFSVSIPPSPIPTRNRPGSRRCTAVS